MSSEWLQTTLGEVIELKRGYDLPQRERKPGSVPLVSSSGVSDKHSEAKVKGPGVVTGRYGTIGEVFFIEDDFWPLNTTLYVRNFKGNDPRFISYFLRGINFGAYTDKAAVPGVNRNDLHRAEVLFPADIETQRAIASVLGMIEDRIENLRKTNATLDAIPQALFKSWFVDFDPVRAKAEGRVPEGMDAVTAALFPSEFEDSELGPIPKGWRCRPLGDALEVQIGGAWGEEAESAKASVNVSCMRGIDAVEIGAGRKPDVPKRWITPKQIAARALREGDILVEGSGSFCGRSLYWIESYADLLPLTPVYSNFVKRLASPQGREVSYWASQHLAQVFHSGEIVNYRTGSAFPNLDTAGLLLKNIATPDTAKIATSLYELVQPLLETKKQNIDRAATLADLRDTLLPRLISGRLRLPEAEREVEAATA